MTSLVLCARYVHFTSYKLYNVIAMQRVITLGIKGIV